MAVIDFNLHGREKVLIQMCIIECIIFRVHGFVRFKKDVIYCDSRRKVVFYFIFFE